MATKKNLAKRYKLQHGANRANYKVGSYSNKAELIRDAKKNKDPYVRALDYGDMKNHILYKKG